MKLPWARESPRWLRAPRSAVGIEAQTGWATDKFTQWAPARAIWVKKIQPLTQKLSAAGNGGDKGEGWPRFYGFSLSTSARWTFRPSCAWTLVFFCPEDSTPAPPREPAPGGAPKHTELWAGEAVQVQKISVDMWAVDLRVLRSTWTYLPAFQGVFCMLDKAFPRVMPNGCL